MKNYQLIPMSEITPEARRIAVLWGDEYFPGIALSEKHKLASDIMNYSRNENADLLKQLAVYENLVPQLIAELNDLKANQ